MLCSATLCTIISVLAVWLGSLVIFFSCNNLLTISIETVKCICMYKPSAYSLFVLSVYKMMFVMILSCFAAVCCACCQASNTFRPCFCFPFRSPFPCVVIPSIMNYILSPWQEHRRYALRSWAQLHCFTWAWHMQHSISQTCPPTDRTRVNRTLNDHVRRHVLSAGDSNFCSLMKSPQWNAEAAPQREFSKLKSGRKTIQWCSGNCLKDCKKRAKLPHSLFLKQFWPKNWASSSMKRLLVDTGQL